MTDIEKLAELDPIPTLESIASATYAPDDTYFRCPKCKRQMHVANTADDDFTPEHGPGVDCDGKYTEITRTDFLEQDAASTGSLADATRSWYEARGLEQPE